MNHTKFATITLILHFAKKHQKLPTDPLLERLSWQSQSNNLLWVA